MEREKRKAVGEIKSQTDRGEIELKAGMKKERKRERRRGRERDRERGRGAEGSLNESHGPIFFLRWPSKKYLSAFSYIKHGLNLRYGDYT